MPRPQLAQDPQFQDRFHWYPTETLGADQLAPPLKVLDGELPTPTGASTFGQHTDHVLRAVLGKSDDEITAGRAAGAHG